MEAEKLSKIEKKFAEDNMKILKYYESSEYYGIAAIAYLEAVRKYLKDKKMQKWKFSTIADKKIKQAVYNEKRKEEKSIKCLSLDEELSYMDKPELRINRVTEKEMLFTQYISKEEDIMKVSYNVGIDEVKHIRKLSRENKLLIDFLKRSEKKYVF